MKELTEEQQKFLDNYFELLGDEFPSNRHRMIAAAGKIGVAGARFEKLVKGISKEIIERTYEWTALHLPHALKGVVDVLDEPTKPGAKNIIAAATTIMDRGGLAKAEKLNIETDIPNAVLILPAKETSNKQ